MARPKKEDRDPNLRVKKSKADKDPNKPKRGQTAFFLWLNENRDRIRKANPSIKITEVTKIAGAEWREMADKSKWEKLAAVDKERYQNEMKIYLKD